jgi:putative transposase
MTNHVHLLVTSTQPGAISRVMQSVGRRYVRGVNARYGRTGTLWEGRFKSCLVDSDAYLLRCLRYIELNPVRAQMVADAADYPWSSVHHHLSRRKDPLITPHPGYLALGSDASSRAVAYRALLDEPFDTAMLDELRRHVAQERAWGSPAFQQMVEAMIGRPVALRGRGRPRAAANSNDIVL